MMSKTFCIIPFIQLEIRNSGQVSSCCSSSDIHKKNNSDIEFNLGNGDTLDEVWTSDSIKKLRQSMLNGERAPGCSYCWKEEDANRGSKRLRENANWGITWGEFPKLLDLKLGNVCNLKCRICTPFQSSAWRQEYINIYANNPEYNFAVDVISFPKSYKWANDDTNFWTNLNKYLPHVELMQFFGGEPFLITRQYELLQNSIKLGHSEKQQLEYVSNGTIYPKDAIENIFPHFKKVSIGLSLDGIGEQFQYQRYPAKWLEIEKNLDLFLSSPINLGIFVHLTISALNVFYLPEYLDYFNRKGVSVKLNILYWDELFSIKYLPIAIKKCIEDKLQTIVHPEIEGVINVMNASSDINLINKLKEKIQVHDEYRKQSYAAVFPEFARILFR